LVVAGRFRLTGLVGEGAQGRVYRAQALVGGAAVAVKQRRLPQTDGWRSWEVADQGQRLLAGVQHPALPIFHHHERLPDGRLVLVRELLEGGSLAERIGEQGARPSAEQVEGLLRDLLELLEFLHTRVPPVIHRDIKPANVLFRSPTSWAPVLVDFDTVAAPEALRTGLTVVGTPGFSAPEQFAGIAEPRSDLYAVGMTLLYAATHCDPADLPRAEGRPDVGSLLAGLRPGLRRVMLRLAEPERADRPPSAAAAIAALDRAAGAASPARQRGRAPDLPSKRRLAAPRRAEDLAPADELTGEAWPQPPPGSRRAVGLVALAVGVLLLVAGAGLTVLMLRPVKHSSPSVESSAVEGERIERGLRSCTIGSSPLGAQVWLGRAAPMPGSEPEWRSLGTTPTSVVRDMTPFRQELRFVAEGYQEQRAPLPGYPAEMACRVHVELRPVP